MGGSETKPHRKEIFRIEDWQTIEWQPYTNIKDPTFSSNFVVYANKINPSLQIEKYQLFFNSQAEYISYLETYYERKKYPSLVNSVHIQQTTKKNMCSTFHSATVYIERIHFRLIELIEIPVQEGLYIIDAALEGYEKMFQKTGYFEVSSDMIGINKQGKVKVWVNKNFSKNFPDFNKIDHNKTEPEFVIDLIKTVQAHFDYAADQPKFSDFVLSKKIVPKFDIVRNLLNQYEKHFRLVHQKLMKSIVLWVRKNSNKQSISSSVIQSQTQSQSKSQIMRQHLKTSSYSTTSEKLPQQHNNNTNSSKKIEFSKLKTRRSNNNINNHHRTIENNAYYIPMQLNPQLLNLNIYNRENNNFSFNIVNREHDYQFERPSNIQACSTFLKKQRKLDQLDERFMVDNSVKIPTKTMNKFPSVSFSYKSAGLYSPQNIQSKQEGWFSGKKIEKPQDKPERPDKPDNKPDKLEKLEKQKKKDYRKSLTTDIYSSCEQKIKFYSSTGDTCQIDPDIAKDLATMVNITK